MARSSTSTYTVDARLTDGAVGDKVGTLLIPEYSCRFDLVLNSATKDSIEVQIEVQYGDTSCVGGRGRFELTPSGLYYGLSTPTGEQIATTLHQGAGAE